MTDNIPASDSPTTPSARADAACAPTHDGRARWLWLGVFLPALVLYAATASRGPQWQDSGWQQVRIVTGQIEHPLGLALTHPVQHYLGRLAILVPWLEPAFAITLVSALAAAVAVANVGTFVALTTGRRSAGIVSAASLALAHTFWQHGTHTESYALIAALLSTEWLALLAYTRTGRPRWLVALALANGLGIATHMLAVLATVVDVVVIGLAGRSGRVGARDLVLTGTAWLCGTLPYTLLILATLIETGDLGGTIRSALVGEFSHAVFNSSISLRSLAMSCGYAVYNFPNLALLLVFVGVGMWRTVTSTLYRVLLAELILHVLFVLRYDIVDQYTFFVPTYAILAVFAGWGVAGLSRRFGGRRGGLVLVVVLASIALNPITYWATSKVLAARGLLRSAVGSKPYRDGYAAFFLPWGIGDDAAERLNQDVFAHAGDNGHVLLGDGMMRYGLLYAQAVSQAPRSVTIESYAATPDDTERERRAALLRKWLGEGQPVILVPRDRDEPDYGVAGAEWRRVGDIYVLDGMAPTAP